MVIPQRRFTCVSEKRLLIVFWAVAALVGLLQSLAERFYIEPDGINYLDVAYAYLRHDFSNAFNAYWSPLYSWLIALLFAVTHSPAQWESTALHALNFLIYLLSLCCFTFFFRELTLLIGEERATSGKKPFPRPAWSLFGYMLFAYAALELIGVGTNTPDMLVASVYFLATGLLVRMGRGDIGWRVYLTLGAVLALGYLAKAAMFPLSFVFLFSSGFAARNWKKTVPRAASALAFFLLIASPWLLTLSETKGRFTFGEAGRLSYAYYVNGLASVSHWHGEIPGTGTPLHGTRRLSERPPVEEFATPIAGTYPPWYDSSYWDEGVRPHFEWDGQLRMLSANLGQYFRLLSAQKGMAVGLLVLVLLCGWEAYGRAFISLWPFWVPAVATLGLYALVLVETRYVGGAIVVLWCTLFAATRLARSKPPLRVWTFCLVAVGVALGVTMAAQAARDLMAIVKGQTNVQWQVAQELGRHNMHKGDLVTVLGHSHEGDYWAHLAQVRIVAEVPTEGVPDYWDANAETRLRINKLLSQSGARFLVSRIAPPPSQAADWEALGPTGYYVLMLAKAEN